MPGIRVQLPRNSCSRSSESVFTMLWNGCSRSVGICVHDASEYPKKNPILAKPGFKVAARRISLGFTSCRIRLITFIRMLRVWSSQVFIFVGGQVLAGPY